MISLRYATESGTPAPTPTDTPTPSATPTRRPIGTPVSECPETLPPRVRVGSYARVAYTNGFPLNVRDSVGGRIVAQIPQGTQFDVINGPRCQMGYRWWQIRTANGIVGWVVEGNSGIYYIEPWSFGSSSPTPASGITSATITECPGAPSMRLNVGDYARVTHTDGRRSVSEPPQEGVSSP